MIKRYRYRAYPTKEQDHYFQQIFGSCRFVYNWGLDLKIKSYHESKDRGEEKPKGLSVYDISKMLTDFKKQEDFKWLNDVPSICLNWSLQHLDTAFKNFFKMPQNGFPKFKPKYKSVKAFSFHQGYKIAYNRISVPKSGWLKFVRHRNFTGQTKTVTVIQEPSGKYYVSIVVDDGIIPKEKLKFDRNKTLGIDVGIVNSVTLSNDYQFHMDIDFKKEWKILAKQQQKLSRKVKGSSNYAKQKVRVAKVNERIRFAREYQIKRIVFLLTDYLIENGFTGIAIRKYGIKEMINRDRVEKDDENKTKKGERKKKKRLNRSLINGSMGMLCGTIKQKCAENGINIMEMDASEIKTTGRCRICDSEDVVINLNSRNLCCKKCGHNEDIDLNAAKNVLAYCLENQKG